MLLLADGRLPAGGYAHSGGMEAAVRSSSVKDVADLRKFLAGRATTSGAVAASFAAAACRICTEQDVELIAELDMEFTARTPSPALRRVSETLGRQLLRAVAAIHPHEFQQHLPTRLHHPVAFGSAAAMFGLSPVEAARGILHETLMGPAMSVVKIMSIDPFEAHRAVAALIPLLDEVSAEAALYADAPFKDLPSYGAPLSDLLAEHHETTQGVRLFAS